MTNADAIANQPIASEQLINNLVEEATSSHLDVIQTVIASLEQDNSAMVSHTDSSYLWKFKYGSVEVFVQLSGLAEEDTIAVWAKVLNLPTKNDAGLMRKLLEMNWNNTFEACFGIDKEQVVVLSSRTLAELSPGEISRIITIVATIADDNDEALQAEFGAA
ncbi:MAG: YbjN domain-containing protein [Tatlockia sp.]|nr:YbjN domain-containing protein [Tatlockia sp.]